MPARVLLQDFTGVPAVVDLAVMRDAMADLGGDPAPGQPARPGRPRHRPLRPGRPVRDARRVRLQRRARVRAQRRALPAPALGPDRVPRPARRAARDRHRPPGQPRVPGHGRHGSDRCRRPPGRLSRTRVVGTDSHTTMVNGLGVLGYGVGGIEAEAVLLGQPLYQPMPHVVGVRLHGALPRGSTATDLVLVVTELLRAHGVVGSFVEFAGDGLATLALADRTTISNMSPEFGATSTLFPIDDETLAYLRLTGRSAERVELVERYAKDPGPVARARRRTRLRRAARARPRQRRPRPWPGRGVPRTACRWRRCGTTSGRTSRTAWKATIAELGGEEPVPGNGRRRGIVGRVVPGVGPAVIRLGRRRRRGRTAGRPGRRGRGDRWTCRPTGRSRSRSAARPSAVRTGSVAIAAITSCTNTSNPTVMVGAGLLARNAVARGLRVGPTVKTSLAPGSRAVTGYLEAAGLMAPLEALGLRPGRLRLHDVHRQLRAARRRGRRGDRGERPGRRRGPLGQPQLRGPDPPARARELPGLPAPGRRLRAGRPGRHRPDDRAARARTSTAGRSSSPTSGRSPRRSGRSSARAIDPELFRRTYATVFEGDDRWRALPIPAGDRYAWESDSTYIAKPPFFEGLPPGRGRAGRHRRACGSWPCSAIRSPPTTSPPPARSRRRHRPASGSRRTASGRSTSTRTAPGAATTR